MKLPDVREALSHINSLDRDEGARAWMLIGDRYMANGRAAGQSGRTAEAREDFLRAYRYFKFGHYPTDNSPDKKRSYAKGIEAFLAYARYLDPPLEVMSAVPPDVGQVQRFAVIEDADNQPDMHG